MNTKHSEPFYISGSLFDNRRLKRRLDRWLERQRQQQLQQQQQQHVRNNRNSDCNRKKKKLPTHAATNVATAQWAETQRILPGNSPTI